MKVSTAGGAQARWNPSNPEELFYIRPDGMLMRVSLTLPEDGLPRDITEVPMFEAGIGTPVRFRGLQYDVHPDGRFLKNRLNDVTSPIHVVENWKPPWDE